MSSIYSHILKTGVQSPKGQIASWREVSLQSWNVRLQWIFQLLKM